MNNSNQLPDQFHEWGIPTGAPEEFGCQYESAPLQKARVWDLQEAFLALYRTNRRIGKSAESVGLTRWAVDKWRQRDVFGFNDRLRAAHADYCENVIEADIDKALEDTKYNHDILRIFRAKAEMPGKYREEVKAVGDSTGRQLFEALREAARKELEAERLAAQEQSAVEGQFREADQG